MYTEYIPILEKAIVSYYRSLPLGYNNNHHIQFRKSLESDFLTHLNHYIFSMKHAKEFLTENNVRYQKMAIYLANKYDNQYLPSDYFTNFHLNEFIGYLEEIVDDFKRINAK